MAKFIPKGKLSKKAQKKLNRQRRVTWEFSPVTKTVESKKLYNRKKNSFDRYDDYGIGVFQFSVHRVNEQGSAANMIDYHVTINGIPVTASYSEQAVEEIFLPLLTMLTEMQKRKGRRILVMLAAPPGAGKSTLLSFLEHLTKEHGDLGSIQTIGMDGFHRRQEYLVSHTVQRDGEEISMVKIKGAPVTFDLEHLTESVKKVAAGENCGWPVYNRLLHNPTENALKVSGDIVILEGNNLLLNEPGWSELKNYADYTISVSAEEDCLRERLIDRRIKTGVDPEASTQFVDFSDMPNVRLCLKKTAAADLELRIDAAGDYHIVSGGLDESY